MGIAWHLASPLLMWLLVVAGFVVCWRSAPETLVFSAFWPGRIAFLAIFLVWLKLFRGAMKVHKQAARSVAGVDKLITEGIYERMRHPLYTGDILLIWGIFLLVPEVRLMAGAVWMTLVLAGWMLLEEKFLLEKFGQEYADYKKKTPMILFSFKHSKFII